MQKQKIMSSIKSEYILAVQHSYNDVEIGIYLNKKLLSSKNIPKNEASSKLINSIDSILKNEKIDINNIQKIVVNSGPGPFTTLRTTITTINGIAFATGIPIIGVDGLSTLINYDLNNYKEPKAVIMNAYGNDVYYALKDQDKFIMGADNIDNVINKLKLKNLKLTGNAVEMFREKLTVLNFEFIKPEYPTLDSLVKNSINFEAVSQVKPIYLKNIKIF